MMTLKYPTPAIQPENSTFPAIFNLYPQGMAGISLQNDQALQHLREAIRQRVPGECRVTCHPHRVGTRSNVALHFEGERGVGQCVDILITVAGTTSWPESDDYDHPRWYVSVPDAVDVVYLVLYLKEMAAEKIPGISTDAQRLLDDAENQRRNAAATTESLRRKLARLKDSGSDTSSSDSDSH